MAKKDIISKMKKMMPKGKGEGKMLELSVETPEEEAYEHAPGGPEEGKEGEEINIPLDGMDEEMGEGPEHEASESPEFEAGEEEGAPMDLADFSEEELLAELKKRKQMASPKQAKPSGRMEY
jgi:hypothetical protein